MNWTLSLFRVADARLAHGRGCAGHVFLPEFFIVLLVVAFMMIHTAATPHLKTQVAFDVLAVDPKTRSDTCPYEQRVHMFSQNSSSFLLR